MKTCSKCKEEKSLDMFPKRKSSKDGYNCNCKQCKKEMNIRYRQNPEVLERIREQSREYRRLNKDIINVKRNLLINKEKVKIQRREYKAERKKNDPFYHTSNKLRKRVWAAFKKARWNKNNATQEILGCDFKTAYNHIESQFKDGMCWDNRSKWHIDHIIPLASATTEEELIKLCHYTNLQPLWAEENLKKGCKISK